MLWGNKRHLERAAQGEAGLLCVSLIILGDTAQLLAHLGQKTSAILHRPLLLDTGLVVLKVPPFSFVAQDSGGNSWEYPSVAGSRGATHQG